MLDLAWEWYLPALGPTYSLTAVPGSLEMVIPDGANHWTRLDMAPELRRSDVGTGDWAIETYVSLGASNTSDVAEFDLIVGFDRFDQYWLRVTNDHQLHITHAGQGDSAMAANLPFPLFLRIEDKGALLRFEYKQESQQAWSLLGTRPQGRPVAYVGAMGRNVASGNRDAVFDLAYFHLERSGSAATAEQVQSEVDDFSGPALSSAWAWRIPKKGPSASLMKGLNLTLPAQKVFDRWGATDEAPQLRRSDMGSQDWAIETELTEIDGMEARYMAGLLVGFDEHNQIMTGMDDSGQLTLQRTTDAWPDHFGNHSLPLYLRLEKNGEWYTLKYRSDPAEAWTVMAAHDYPGTPEYVGLIARVLNSGATLMTIHWAGFRLDRWSSLPTPTPAPTAVPTPTTNEQPINTAIPTLAAEQKITLAWLHMFDASSGWGIETGGHILQTRDGGNTWEDVTPPGGIYNQGGFFALNTAIAWATPYQPGCYQDGCPAPPLPTTIWHTLDGGKTWQPSQTLCLGGNCDYTYNVDPEFLDTVAMQFIDEQHGWMLVNVSHGMFEDRYRIYQTSDSGNTWTMPVDNTSGPTALQVTGLAFQDAQTGWLGVSQVMGAGAPSPSTNWIVYRTQDAGHTWETIGLQPPGRLPAGFDGVNPWCGVEGVHTLPPRVIDIAFFCTAEGNYASFSDPYARFHYHSIDGGQTWQTWPATGNEVFINALNGWRLFVSETGSLNELQNTTDGGLSWTTIQKVAWPKAQLDFIYGKNGWAIVTDQEGTFTLVHTQDDGVTWSKINPVIGP
jgi:photosystem II stability/assembly factor-like uncharacterized protein